MLCGKEHCRDIWKKLYVADFDIKQLILITKIEGILKRTLIAIVND